MTFVLGMPFDGQSLGNSKPQVRGNFTTIYNWGAVNHIAMNSAGAGKHFFVEMPNQASNVTIANECGIYAKSLGSAAFSNVVWQQENGGADPLRNQGAVIQMTNILPLNAATGRSFLPGGLLLLWGQCTSAAGGGITPDSNTITYTSSGEGFTLAGVASNPWVVLVTPAQPEANVIPGQAFSATNYTQTSFDLATSSYNARPFVYFIIGPKT